MVENEVGKLSRSDIMQKEVIKVSLRSSSLMRHQATIWFFGKIQ